MYFIRNNLPIGMFLSSVNLLKISVLSIAPVNSIYLFWSWMWRSRGLCDVQAHLMLSLEDS